MKVTVYRFLIAILVSVLAASNSLGAASAVSVSPAQAGESIRSALVQAQLTLSGDPGASTQLVKEAESAYQTGLSDSIAASDPEAHLRVATAFESLAESLSRRDAASFAAARAQAWTGILAGSYSVVEDAIQSGDGQTAQTWLPLREFRTATRFSRPNVGATVSVENLMEGNSSTEATLLSVRADVLDTYQARLTESLHDLAAADANGFATRRAELATLAEGYFFILSPAYLEQKGSTSLLAAQAAFHELWLSAIDHPQQLSEKLVAVEAALGNFRAAPLSPAEQSRRAGQLMRFLSLVPVEYGRGVVDGRVTQDIEIQEAITFHTGAYAAFTDLKDLLDERDRNQTVHADALFESLGKQLSEAGTHRSVASPEAIKSQTNELSTVLQELIPEEWLKSSAQGDFDVIASMLDQMLVAVRNGQYDLAESSRLDAYAIMETGPEARLMVFAPELKLQLEELFWNGQGTSKGLAYLIKNQASYSEIKATRLQLDVHLSEAQTELTRNTAPTAVAMNAGIIVFREGLEAVVILASLMSSLKSAEERKYRQPMWLGSLLALLATALTWLLAHEVLQSLARYGEKLEAVVSILAIAVLLLIMNWFFHKTYWTSWLANFHATKRRLLNEETGLFLGLIALGFTSVYREGFEIVLFLQALVLEGGVPVVLMGVIGASIAVALVGMIVFRLQKNLPYMKILVITGILIGSVLLQMVGSTVHVLQVVGWLPIHVIPWFDLPYWLGTWFGVYPTWEGFVFQLAAMVFVIGSYYLAEGMRKHRLSSRSHREALKPAPESQLTPKSAEF
ncbi:MAG TPA: FTR1 family protein [Anaerolineales bacterium]|nr:FTR1 family protein [Anaerolineales bacterium]